MPRRGRILNTQEALRDSAVALAAPAAAGSAA
jgi:hypothetical protein